MNGFKKIALIPAYEPAQILNEVVEDLLVAGFEMVVVDDGSGPEYSKIFEEVGAWATVLTHSENMGKGRALKTGFEYIQKHYGKSSVIVTVDADGQHSASDALKICDEAELHPDTLVLGSRKLGKDVPFRSRFGNSMTRFVYRISTGLKVYDTQTGLRAFSMDLMPQMLEINGERYEYEMNVLLEFAKEKIPIMEEEIETIYIDDNSSSHFDTIKDSYRVYKEIIKFSASSLAGFLVDYVTYGLLLLITGNLVASNVGARTVSATVNYTLNRRFVFKSHDKVLKSAFSYFLLAAGILLGNTLVLRLLVTGLHINSMVAKIITEALFFAISWAVQRSFVFKSTGKDSDRNANREGLYSPSVKAS